MTLAIVSARDPLAGFAIGRTLPLEGGLVDADADPGSITNHGISLRYALAEAKLHPDMVRMFDVDHDGHVTRLDIRGLTSDLAADVLFTCWWLPGWYGALAPEMVSWKCFDISVNTGPNRAAIILQKALAEAGSAVAVDGAVGPATLAAVKRQATIQDGATLLSALRDRQAAFYTALVVKEPSLKPFLKGWLNRAVA